MSPHSTALKHREPFNVGTYKQPRSPRKSVPNVLHIQCCWVLCSISRISWKKKQRARSQCAHAWVMNHQHHPWILNHRHPRSKFLWEFSHRCGQTKNLEHKKATFAANRKASLLWTSSMIWLSYRLLHFSYRQFA